MIQITINKGVKVMESFGYDKEFDKWLKLSQVIFSCKKENLDSIIDFLTYVKKEIETFNVEEGDHWHYRDYNDSWNEKEPDLIVYIDNDKNK